MEVSSVLVSGIVIIIGSALFLCAAFSPISFRVLPEKSATRKLEVIRASPTAWSVTQILFGLGPLVTVIGVGLLAYALRRQPSAWLIWTSVALLILAAVLWLWHVYGRTVDPVAFPAGRWPRWPRWIGWMLIGSMVLLFVLTLVYSDIAPFWFYVVTLIAGIALLAR